MQANVRDRVFQPQGCAEGPSRRYHRRAASVFALQVLVIVTAEALPGSRSIFYGENKAIVFDSPDFGVV